MYNVNMKLKFVWDDEKYQKNLAKHGVTFEEASEVFTNFPLEVFFDPENSEDEDRYIAVGFSNDHRTLVVVHCEQLDGKQIRIISARPATKKEKRTIFGGRLK
jgi:uncharacterized DUF497 family protein